MCETNNPINTLNSFASVASADSSIFKLGLLLLTQSLTPDAFLIPIPSSFSMNGMSFAWYMPLTQFETIFLTMIMIQIFVLRWLDILPININNALHGDPSGRKRRALLANSQICRKPDDLMESVFNLIRRMDENDCFLQTICQIKAQSNYNTTFNIPEEIQQALLGIELISQTNRETCNGVNVTNFLDPFEEALIIGSSSTHPNLIETHINSCEGRYHLCPLSPDDLTHYTGLIFNSM